MNDFSSGTMGMTLPNHSNAFDPVGPPSGGIQTLTYSDFDEELPYWSPTYAKTWGMNLDATRDYEIEIDLEVTTDDGLLDPITVRFSWRNQAASWPTGQQIFLDVPTNTPTTIRLHTWDTTAYPQFLSWGDPTPTVVNGFELKFGIDDGYPGGPFGESLRLATGPPIFGKVLIDRVSFVEDTNPKAIYGTAFLGHEQPAVSQGSSPWVSNYTNQTPTITWHGDSYVSVDKKDTAAVYYPKTGLFDNEDPAFAECLLLIARTVGLDGLVGEVGKLESRADRALDEMELVRTTLGYDVRLGLHLLGDTWVQTTLDDHPLFTSRLELQGHLLTDLQAWMGKLGALPKWKGDDLLFFFNASPDLCPDFDDETITAADIDYLTGGTSPLLDAKCIGRSSNPMDPFMPQWQGYFAGLPANVYVGTSPWEFFATVFDVAGDTSSGPMSFLETFYDKALAPLPGYNPPGCPQPSTPNPIEIPVGGIYWGKDDHRHEQWGQGNQRRINHDTTALIHNSFDRLEDSGVGLAFVTQMIDFAEGISFYPTREFGYLPLEALGSRVWAWRGAPQLYQPALIRLPERLLEIRKQIALLEEVGVTTGMASLESEADAVGAAINDLDLDAALSALATAEASAAALLGTLEAEWISLTWQRASGVNVENGIQYVTNISNPIIRLVNEYGKQGLSFIEIMTGLYVADFVVESPYREMLRDGAFRGQVAVEYLDKDERRLRINGTSARMTSFIKRKALAWSTTEVDAVNTSWNGSYDIRLNQSSEYPGDNAGRNSGVHWVRLQGTVYSLPE